MIRYSVIAFLSIFSVQVSAAIIFECEAVSSGRFYSTNDCTAHRAVIVSRHTVPDGLPFEQQVDLINKRHTSRNSAQTAENQANEKNRQCAGIDYELQIIQKKYTSWQYVPIDEVNADQTKERDLRAKRLKFGCASK